MPNTYRATELWKLIMAAKIEVISSRLPSFPIATP